MFEASVDVVQGKPHAGGAIVSTMQYISGRVRIGERTFRAWVRMRTWPNITYSITYEDRFIFLQQLGDGSFCELKTAVVRG